MHTGDHEETFLHYIIFMFIEHGLIISKLLFDAAYMLLLSGPASLLHYYMSNVRNF